MTKIFSIAARRSIAQISLVLAASWLLALTPSICRAQSLRRLSARFMKFDNTEFVAQATDTAAADNGVQIYDNEIKVPADINVLFIHISGTGDLNGDDVSEWFGCTVDGDFCNKGSTFATDTPGWIALLSEQAETEHDNNVNYTWCVPIRRKSSGPKGLMHEVQLRMASNGGGSVFLEGVHVFIDGAKMTNKLEACTLKLAD